MIFVPAIVFEMLCFEIVFRPHSNGRPAFSNSFYRAFLEKVRFRDGLVWTAGMTTEKKLFKILKFLRGLNSCSLWVIMKCKRVLVNR